MPTKAKSLKEGGNWKKNLTPQIVICLILCIFSAAMTAYCFLRPGTKEVSVTSLVEDMKPLDAVTPEDRLVQTFTADDNYSRFGLYYANFSNYIQGGELHVDVRDASGRVANFAYNIGGVIDNTFIYIDYPVNMGETYTLTIYISGTAQGITFFTTMADSYEATLQLNNQPQNASIIMSFVSQTQDSFKAWYGIMAISLLFCYMSLKVNKDFYDK